MFSPIGMVLTLWLGLLLVLGGGCRNPAMIRTSDRDAEPRPSEAEFNRAVQAHAHYASGVSAEINGDTEKALEYFLAAAREDPDHPTLTVEVVGRLMQAGKTDRARQLLVESTQSPKAPGDLFAWLGMVYATLDELDLAEAANLEAVKRSPLLLFGYQNLVSLYAGEDRYPAVLAMLQKAGREKTADANFLLALVRIYSDVARVKPLLFEDIRQAILEVLDRAASQQPEESRLQQQLADGYRAVGAFDQAEAVYLQLLARSPVPPLARESLAELYLRTGQNEKAAEQLEAITRDNPRNERASYFLGSLIYEERRFAEAEELFERILVMRPEFEPVYYDLAGVKLALEKPEETLKLMDEARTRFQEKFLVEFYSGLAYAQAERYDEAVRAYTEAELLARNGEPERLSHQFYFQYGAAYERRGDYEQAAECFRKCLEMEPRFTEAMNYLGYMWAEQDVHLDEAMELISKAVEMEPENAAYLDSLGWVFYQLEDYEEALTWILKAVDLSEEKDPTLQDHLGDVYHKLGRMPEAREAWSESLKMKEDEAIRLKMESLPAQDSGLER